MEYAFTGSGASVSGRMSPLDTSASHLGGIGDTLNYDRTFRREDVMYPVGMQLPCSVVELKRKSSESLSILS